MNKLHSLTQAHSRSVNMLLTILQLMCVLTVSTLADAGK